MAITLGTLLIELRAETAAFTSGLDKASHQAIKSGEDMKKALTAAGVAIGAALGTAAAGFAAMVENAAQSADHLNKLAQSAGVSVESLSALAYAANLSDIDIDSLGTSIEKLSKNMLQAADGSQEQSRAFQRLGVDVTDSNGQLRDVSDVVQQLAGKFSGMENGAAKTALAMQIFGKSGAAMIPLLNSGSDGIAKMTEEAQKLGVVIDGETALAAESFNDNLTRMEAAFKGVANTMLKEIAPAMAGFSASIVESIKQSNGLQNVGSLLGDLFRGVAGAVLITVNLMDNFGTRMQEIGAIAVAVARRDWGAISGAIDNANADIERSANQLAGSLVKMWDQVQAAEKPHGSGGGGTPTFAQSIKQDIIELQSSLWGALPNITAAMRSIWDSVSVPKDAKSGIEEITDILNRHDQQVADEMKRTGEEAQRVWEQTRTPLEKYNEELQKLTDLLNKGAIDQDTFNRAAVQLGEELDKNNKSIDEGSANWKQFGQNAIDSLEQAALHGQGFSAALKAIIIDLATMILKATLFKNVFKDATGGGGGGIGGILGSIFTGIFGGGSGSKKASGGPVEAGKGYLVGEEGPEPFIPSSNGFILPHGALAGAGGPNVIIQQSYDFRSADPGSEARIRRQLEINKRETVQTAIAAIRELNRRT